MSQSDQQTPSFGESHAATLLLRELLDVTEDFERTLGDELSVNPTDLTAMQHLIVAGALSPTALAERLELSSAAVTTVIDRLEALGHARRYLTRVVGAYRGHAHPTERPRPWRADAAPRPHAGRSAALPPDENAPTLPTNESSPS